MKESSLSPVTNNYRYKDSINYSAKPKEVILCEHQSGITASLLISNKILLTGAYDGTIKEWDISTGDCLHTYSAHESGVYSLVLINENVFVSGGWDGLIKVWNCETHECCQVFDEHKNHISDIKPMQKGLIASASYDGTIKVWDVNQHNSLYTLTGHTNYIFRLATSNNLLASASGNTDKSIKLWDINERKCVQTFIVEDALFTSALTFTKEDILISGSGSKLRFWDTKKYECYKEISGFDGGIFSLTSLFDGSIAVGSMNKIVLIDPINGKPFNTIFSNSECVSSLLNSTCGFLLRGGNDGIMKIYKFPTKNLHEGSNFHRRHHSTPEFIQSESASTIKPFFS
jgi:WD40 repeat protein